MVQSCLAAGYTAVPKQQPGEYIAVKVKLAGLSNFRNCRHGGTFVVWRSNMRTSYESFRSRSPMLVNGQECVDFCTDLSEPRTVSINLLAPGTRAQWSGRQEQSGQMHHITLFVP
jgi:hypothetical protein